MFMPSIFEENLFDDFFEEFTRPARRVAKYANPTMAIMRTDIKETDAGYELQIELPGCKKEDIKAELKNGTLTISATINTENDNQDENGRYIRRERFYGNCSRSFHVGDVVEKSDIKARFEDGILMIFVPKKEAKPAVEESEYIAIEG